MGIGRRTFVEDVFWLRSKKGQKWSSESVSCSIRLFGLLTSVVRVAFLGLKFVDLLSVSFR